MNDYDLWMSCTDRSDYVDRWYSLISDLTFPTFFLPFTITEAEALLSLIKHTLDPNPKKRSLPLAIIANYDAFVTRVECEVAKVLPTGSRFFGRLGSRSPKDATFSSSSGRSRFRSAVKRLFVNKYSEQISEKLTQPIGFDECEIAIRAEVEAMACCNVKEMFEMFVNSERIRDDIIRELKFSDPNLMIVIRQWEDNLNPLLEFRGFVCNHNLCGITQYDTRWCVDLIKENQRMICDEINQFFVSKVKPRLLGKESVFSSGTYCVDFAVMSVNPIEVKVVELNQLSLTTGTGLFDWDTDANILHGEEEFAFRIVEEWPMKLEEVRYWVSGSYLQVRDQLQNEAVREGKTHRS
jgi:hypothetical protein